MKRILAMLLISMGLMGSGCDINDPYGGGDPFGYFNRVTYNGYTYVNNFGSSVNNKYITFTSLGGVGNIKGEYASAMIDSTFYYNSGSNTVGNLLHTDTLYFATKSNGDIRFLSYGYYRVIPTWIDLFRFSDTNRYFYQSFDERINGTRWELEIRSRITTTTVYSGVGGNLPAYRLEMNLDYSAPFNTDLTFVWYWSRNYGLIIYDEQRDGLIYQIAKDANY